jgi:ABC-type branched-subunit amino acid transport system substrate-binding protein
VVETKNIGDTVEKTPLVVGFIMDLSRGVGAQGRAVLDGIELRMKEAHEAGDQTIAQVAVADDEYTPRKTRKEVENFLQRGTDILLAPGGSPTLESYIDWVKEGRVLVLFPITGAPMFRSPDLTYIAHIRPSYKTEGEF